MEVSGQLQAPAAFPPGKSSPVATGYEIGRAPEVSSSNVKLLKYLSCIGKLIMTYYVNTAVPIKTNTRRP
jgi:hypothetical protein